MTDTRKDFGKHPIYTLLTEQNNEKDEIIRELAGKASDLLLFVDEMKAVRTSRQFKELRTVVLDAYWKQGMSLSDS